MCNSAMHRPLAGVVDPFSFSTIHFLRTCNRLMTPTEFRPYYNLVKEDNSFEYITNTSGNSKSLQELKKSEIRCPEITTFPIGCSKEMTSSLPTLTTATPCSPVGFDCLPEYPFSGHTRLSELNYSNFMNRRQRGEKKPIPDEQKDEKYYERRKRNNEAAKKSRDARKMREDRIAFRAAVLEQENAILRAQVVALREEMTTLRQMMGTRPAQISVNL